MKDFILVFKTIFRNHNSRKIDSRGKKRLSSGLTLVLSSSPLLIFICAAAVFLTMGITDIKLLAALMTIVVFAAQLCTLFVSLFSVVNTMYSSPDISILNSLPLKPVPVFAAKLANVYLSSYGMSAMITIPLLLVMAVTYNVVNGSIFYGIYPFIILISFVVPVLPLFLIILFSMPITFLGSYFKGKPVIKSVLTIAVYIILISAYMVAVYYMNTKGFGQEGTVVISGSLMAGLLTFAKAAYPDYVLVNYALGIEFGKNFGISVAITVGMIVVLLLLSFLFYRKITEKRLESQSGISSKNAGELYKKESIVRSLIGKDFKSIIRNTGMAVSSFANTILAPIFIVVMYFTTDFKVSSGTGGEMPELMGEMMGIGFVIIYSFIFLSGTNMLAMIAYTREGENFYITKSLPISAKDSLSSKLILSVIPSVIFGFIIMLISIFLYRIDIVSSVLAFVCTFIVSAGTSALHIYYDMKYGNIHWKTNADMNRISKGNKGSFVIVMMDVFLGVVFFAVGMILSAFAEFLGVVIIKVIYWSLILAVSVAVCAIGFAVLRKNEHLFDTIGDNTELPKRKGREKSNSDMLRMG